MKKHILVIVGSASKDSANEKLMMHFASITKDHFNITIINDLKAYPHFDPVLSADHAPDSIIALRSKIQDSDAIVICTPEYVFSIPSGLKNIIEWCVSTTVFMNKPTGLITASANGEKAHEELKLIMRTVMCNFNDATTLLIRGIKGKIGNENEITDSETQVQFTAFVNAFKALVAADG